MRLINTTRLEFEEFFDSQLPKYAILTHCWAQEEVTYEDFLSGAKRGGAGWQKIVKCCQIACEGNLDWAWVDTCCIDKSSTAELSEAINSMYRWYQEAEVCYVLLPDYCSVQEYPTETDRTSDAEVEPGSPLADTRQSSDKSENLPDDATSPNLRPAFATHSTDVIGSRAETTFSTEGDADIPPNRTAGLPDEEVRSTEDVHVFAMISTKLAESRWFTRGWTLQELLAPRIVLFYDHAGVQFGSKESLATTLSEITGIDIKYLGGESTVDDASVSCRMSWASKRQTTRKEDIAYCLLGLFDISMPLLYGEGASAFQRLQEEIIARNDDHTIFAWTTREQDNVSNDKPEPSSILARSPEYFRDGAFFVPLSERPPPCRITSIGIEVPYPHSSFLDIITFGKLRESSAGIGLPLAFTDTRWSNWGTAAQITICRDIEFSRTSLVYYRIGSAGISPVGRSMRHEWRPSDTLGKSYSSVHVQRLQIASGRYLAKTGRGIDPVPGLLQFAWMCVLVCVTIALLQLPFADIDRDVVRLWASFGILLLLGFRRELYLLALIAVSYLPLGGEVVWLAVITAVGILVCLYIFVWLEKRKARPIDYPPNIYRINLERFFERLNLRL